MTPRTARGNSRLRARLNAAYELFCVTPSCLDLPVCRLCVADPRPCPSHIGIFGLSNESGERREGIPRPRHRVPCSVDGIGPQKHLLARNRPGEDQSPALFDLCASFLLPGFLQLLAPLANLPDRCFYVLQCASHMHISYFPRILQGDPQL